MIRLDRLNYQIGYLDGVRLNESREIKFVEREGAPIKEGLVHCHYGQPSLDWKPTSTDPKSGHVSISIARPNGLGKDRLHFDLNNSQYERMLKNPDGKVFHLEREGK
jgi:hypothetical protein